MNLVKHGELSQKCSGAVMGESSVPVSTQEGQHFRRMGEKFKFVLYFDSHLNFLYMISNYNFFFFNRQQIGISHRLLQGHI